MRRCATGRATWSIAGVCGGLDPSLAPGDLVLAHRVVNEAAKNTLPTARCSTRLVARSGSTARTSSSSLLTVARPDTTRAEKTDL
jgi:hypothetical protein